MVMGDQVHIASEQHNECQQEVLMQKVVLHCKTEVCFHT